MVISILIIALIILVLGLFLLPNLLKESPTIVTYKAQSLEEDTLEKKKVNTAVQRKPSAPSSSSAKVIASSAPSDTAIPVVDVMVDSPTVDFGDGQDFGTGWGDGAGFGAGGGGATFFNQSVKADRIAYVIDYSLSMRGAKDKLMRDELTKSISGLSAGTKFQMIFFAGPAWIGGDDASVKESEGTVKAKGGKTYKWTGKGAHGWTPVGKLQKAEWLDMTGSQMKKSLDIIKESRLIWGTDWRNPLEMAFEMDPTPQIVFFMTDGATGGDMMKLTDSLAAKARRKGIMVNSVALMEPKAEEPMLNLAKKTGGVFTIVNAGGKPREVDRIDRKKRRK